MAAAPAPLAYGAYAHAPAVAYAHAPVAPAVSVPAPYTTATQGAAVESVHQPAPVVRKEVHFGETQFVSGYASRVIKPEIPVLPIAVPTALKGSVTHNAPLVKVQKEPYVVNEHYPVEGRVEVPYDVPVIKEQLVEVPVPVHVDQPYAVPHPVPVQGETIVNVRQGPAQVVRTHEARIAAPAVAVAAAPAVAVEGYAAAPATIANAAYGYNLGAYGLTGAYGYAAGLAPAAAIAAAPAVAEVVA